VAQLKPPLVQSLLGSTADDEIEGMSATGGRTGAYIEDLLRAGRPVAA
jgi:hypothetical protein